MSAEPKRSPLLLVLGVVNAVERGVRVVEELLLASDSVRQTRQGARVPELV